jgi:protein-tyrosine kinase
MSRIHEALKKAEQERAALQGDGVPPGYSVDPALVHAAPVQEFPASGNGGNGGNGIASIAELPVFSGAFSLDSLLTKSTQAEWKPDPATMLFLNGDSNAKGAEEYRTLRSRLYTVRGRMALRSVLITSALPREGKSFTSANLAQVLVRQHGRRVLLIDADLRAPRLHLMLGSTFKPGLSDYLQGEQEEFAVMQRGPLENLFFIPSGTPIDDPSELVGNGRFKTLLQRVEHLFDWIVIDSPPAVPVSDASVLARACDGVVIVVRSNSTPFDAARKAREEFPEQQLVGTVLNGTSDKPAYARYYYEAYGKKEQRS